MGKKLAKREVRISEEVEKMLDDTREILRDTSKKLKRLELQDK